MGRLFLLFLFSVFSSSPWRSRMILTMQKLILFWKGTSGRLAESAALGRIAKRGGRRAGKKERERRAGKKGNKPESPIQGKVQGKRKVERSQEKMKIRKN